MPTPKEVMMATLEYMSPEKRTPELTEYISKHPGFDASEMDAIEVIDKIEMIFEEFFTKGNT